MSVILLKKDHTACKDANLMVAVLSNQLSLPLPHTELLKTNLLYIGP